MSIEVLLVDDQTLVRSGIRSLLELMEDIKVVDEAGDGEEGITKMQECQPDIVLLDIRMPVLNGIDTLLKMRQMNIKIPVIILTTFDDSELFLAAIQAGAKGFLLKDVSLESLTEAVRTVAGGGTLIKPTMTERVVKGYHEFKGQAPKAPFEMNETLSKREIEILRLMAGGFSNKEIANAIFKSEGTIKNHVSSILAKLGVRDRTRAVLKAIDGGLI
ncbi:MAG: response regulator transcription factor [Saccharospirillaceae bacterium]|nr:response regulator transcription factor [Pseudomonadales bacterium]NRB77845.1 response regulator transcription factor [Saccharospirillaceae bacterium]